MAPGWRGSPRRRTCWAWFRAIVLGAASSSVLNDEIGDIGRFERFAGAIARVLDQYAVGDVQAVLDQLAARGWVQGREAFNGLFVMGGELHADLHVGGGRRAGLGRNADHDIRQVGEEDR